MARSLSRYVFSSFVFYNVTATTDFYTLSLHDALPIYFRILLQKLLHRFGLVRREVVEHDVNLFCPAGSLDRKSTRLNSSHTVISYAVFCLKKKKGSVRQSHAQCRVQNDLCAAGSRLSR